MFRTKLCRKEKVNEIVIGNTNMQVGDKIKFLGVVIDEHLDWSSHIIHLVGKLSKIAYAFRVLVKYVSESALRALYFANFEGMSKYGIMFWGANSDIQKIFVIQKKVLRVMYKMDYLESCRNVFKTKRIMTIYGLYVYEIVMFFYKNKNRFNLQVYHNYNTRTNNVNYPLHNLTLFERGAYYRCLKFFNKLPEEIKVSPSERVFRKKLKSFLINLELYNLQDFLDECRLLRNGI